MMDSVYYWSPFVLLAAIPLRMGLRRLADLGKPEFEMPFAPLVRFLALLASLTAWAILAGAGVYVLFHVDRDPPYFREIDWQSFAVYALALAGGVSGGVGLEWIIGRDLQPWLFHRFADRTKKWNTEGGLTDIRSIASALPRPREFNHFEFWCDDSLFLGLDAGQAPVYLSLEQFRESHLDFVGPTGFGKSAAAAAMLSQLIFQDEAVFVIDPKGDRWSPAVLHAMCWKAGKPFVYVDLCAPQAQFNLLRGINEAHELEALWMEGFELDRKHDKYDYFRIFERMAAQITSEAAVTHVAPTIARCADEAVELIEHGEDHGIPRDKGLGFIAALRELARVQAFNTRAGSRLYAPLSWGGVFYVRGSVSHATTVIAQQMLMLRLLQILERRPRESRHVTILLEEFKYCLGQTAANMLTTIRDKDCSLILTHQSISDLGKYGQAVLTNCGVQAFWRANDNATAQEISEKSSTFPGRQARYQMFRNDALAELQLGTHYQTEVERPLIDKNTARSLPKGAAIWFGLGAAKLIANSPIRVPEWQPQIIPAIEDLPARLPSYNSSNQKTVKLLKI